ERRARIETEPIRNLALRVGSNLVAHRLQVLIQLVGLRSRLHALLGNEVIGKDYAEADLFSVREGGGWDVREEKKSEQNHGGTHRLMDGRGGRSCVSRVSLVAMAWSSAGVAQRWAFESAGVRGISASMNAAVQKATKVFIGIPRDSQCGRLAKRCL